MRRRATDETNRSGAALVELAICLPLVVLLVCGTIETCNLIFLRNGLVTAAYSGTLQACQLKSTEVQVRSQITQSLNASGISDAAISVTGDQSKAFSLIGRGEDVLIHISAPVATNSPISGFIQPRSQMEVNVRTRR